MPQLNSQKTRKSLKVGCKSYDYFSLKAAEKTLGDLSRLPNSMKVLLENLLRYEDDSSVTVKDIQAVKPRPGTRALTHPVTLMAIGLLLLNDHVLKRLVPRP